MIFFFALFIISLQQGLIETKVPGCCSRIQNDKCRGACHQVCSQTSPFPQMQLLLTAAEGCPPQMEDFWQCINEALQAVKTLSSWPGRSCCELAKTKECRKKCNMAETKDAMTKSCRESTETTLFSCIQREEAGNQCCSKATTSCSIICRGIFLTGEGSTRASRVMLSHQCGHTDRHVEQCVHKHWHPHDDNSHNTLPCCEKAQTSHCRATCRRVLQEVMSEDERIDELIRACSSPQPTDPLWQCFLNNPRSKKNESISMSRIDNAKLLCCGKATSKRCRELCTQAYRSDWSYHTDFESICSYIQPVSTQESNLHNCLTDVDEPCKIGCSGLSFCSNFNNRPIELFRSCTAEADDAAQVVYNSWKNGVIRLPQLTIPVKDISQCMPGMWRAIACTLEIKPCSSQQSPIMLCKEDCLLILTKCVDAANLSGDKTVPSLCNALPSKSISESCISMDSYLYESPHASRAKEVNHPCSANPCSTDEVCLVRRRKCKHAHDCLPYVCHKACPLGQVSKVLVPRGTDIRLTNINEDTSEQDCYIMCHCGIRGIIENCKPLICLKRDPCIVDGVSKAHGDQFLMDGNLCVCSSGVPICAHRYCHHDGHSLPREAGIASHCPAEYKPVCGSSGRTYPNVCMSKCAGVHSILADRACSDEDVCASRPCTAGMKCVPRPQVCLNEITGDQYCPQYVCVNGVEGCISHHHDPVCSSKGEEFTNICLLYSHGQSLGYWGHCQHSCSDSGVVCGHDGETYSSECAARASRVSVDYFGKCKSFGNFTARSSSCDKVQCPAVYPSDCAGVVPPGGCCPVCAAQLKLLWDPRLMTAAASHTKTKVITALDVLNHLSDHISVLECDISGYVSISGELVGMIGPVVSQPSALQVEACQSEAKRMHSLLKMGSPNIASFLSLSPIVLSTLELSVVSSPDALYISRHRSALASNRNSSCHAIPDVWSVFVCAAFLLMYGYIQRVRLKL